MDAEERFHNKRMGYVKYFFHMKHHVPLESMNTNWTMKYVSINGQIVVKRQYKVETWNTSNSKMLKPKSKNQCKNGKQKTHRNDCEQSWEGDFTTEKPRSEGGGRDKLKKVDGDFPTCRRKIEAIMKMKQERRKTWKEKEEDDSCIAPLMVMFRCVWEKLRRIAMTTAAAKERTAKKRKAEAAFWAKRSIVSWTKWRAEAKICVHVQLGKEMTTQRTKKSQSLYYKETWGQCSQVKKIEAMVCELEGYRWDAILLNETWRHEQVRSLGDTS